MTTTEGAVTSAGERTAYITCVLCEASCGLEVKLRDEVIESVRGNERDPLSRGHICPKAIALQDIHDDPDRLRKPVRRDGEDWIEIEWEEAIDLVATRLAAVQAEHGRNAVGVYLGNPNVHSLGALTHGLNLVRTIGTKNTFSATSADQLPHQLTAWALYGHQFLMPVPDIDRADLIVLFGHNPMASNGSIWTVPDFPARRRELASRGGRLVVVDPRRTETAKVADEHHFVRPGTDVWVLLAMLREVLALGARPAAHVDGIEAVRRAVEPFTPEVAESFSGMPAASVRGLAAALHGAGAGALHGRMGVSTQAHGVTCQWAIQCINILTGNLDRPGGTMFTTPAIDLIAHKLVPAGHLGAWRSRVRGLPEFGSELPVSTLADEMLTPGEGQLRALVSIAGNPVSSTPGGHRLDAALDGLDFMVAIDIYINETTRHADVILPPTGPLEREHYDLIFHTLAVRNTARWSPALFDKPDSARHDWEIARDLSFALIRARGDKPSLVDQGRFRVSPRMIIDGLLRVGPVRGGVKKVAKTPGGVDLGALQSQLPERLQTPNKRIHLAPDVLMDAVTELADHVDVGPITLRDNELLLIGRRHQRDNNSWMHNAPRLTKGRPRHHLLAHPDDLAERGIVDGSFVRVRSASGAVEVEVSASEDMMPGVVSLPHGYGHGLKDGVRMRFAVQLPGVSINDLTDPSRTEAVGANAVLNGVPVTIEALAAADVGN
ncbi:MAG TPA: molybdopterin-dependent oxidoreductase [Phycicoccus sp.]|jgi:anaerobic selenocysteine-containing dehydrogenase|nr:molybdopterin-dependent oxidoreductase [Phycicoccus sp.]HQH06802.1 molybdopterin-dependent oxidoreductase [Phycicoccus sp.]HQK30680.1 molybdopterin-dependent oxidoreductase [Phycicoccus sp.]HQY95534.1 molybdopterin-dependent oxidoreductase [Phycicoccus sp.]HRA43882.1 molybdopterin-dependent oxidoreductase [Phycicoccus sp.]